MNSESWFKNPAPVYTKKLHKGIYHTGHCSFLYRENGEIYMVYHATDNADFSKAPRCTYIKKLKFLNSYPIF